MIDFNTAKRQGEPYRGAVDADDIRSRLHADPRGFIEWLYSGRAFIHRNEARIGDASGTPGASLSIHLSGPDAGLWKDHATDEGGDLIGLYRAWAGYHDNSNFVLSLKEIARDYFGDPVEVERTPWQPTPTERIEKKKATLGTKPRADMLELGAPVATYRYYDTRGNVIASVVRFEPDGTRESKTFRPFCHRTIDGVTKWTGGAPDLRPLYRLPEIALASTVVLVEGEGCADALARVGIEATSAMQGANAPIDKTDWSPLIGKTIIIWPDNDAPGFDYAKRVATKLGSMGCRVLAINPPNNAPAKWDAADCVAEGGDAAALISGATELAAPTKPRVRLVNISDLGNLTPPAWLIQDVLTEHGLSMVWGRSGSLKSFAVLDMGLCIATGLSWHGKAVRQGRVVYLAAEGSQGLVGRINGWMQNRGRDCQEPDFQVIPHGLTLVNDGDLEALIAAINERPVPPAFIVIDTLSRTFGSGNPNQPSDMNAFVSACDRLKDATGAHVLVVHHGGKDTDKNELGNESLRNASDTVIHVRRKDDTIELVNEAPKGKQKDAEEFPTIKLEAVKIAHESNGKESTTLILNLREDDGKAGPEGTADVALGKIEKQIIAALTKAGEPLGLTRLALMTGAHNKSLTRALDTLNDKNLVIRADDGDENRKLWRLA